MRRIPESGSLDNNVQPLYSEIEELHFHFMSIHDRPGWRVGDASDGGFRLCHLAVVALATVFIAAQPARAVPQSPPLASDEIVARLVAMDAKRTANAPPYTGTRHYTLDYKGFPSDRHAEMDIKVVSTPPQKQLTIVSESGSKLLITRVLRKLIESEREADQSGNRRDTKLLPENYDFQLVGKETSSGRECYVLQVTPKKKNKFLYVGKLWVDAQEFAVVRISAKPAKNPSFWISSVEIDHRYGKHGELWLPESNRSTSKVRLGGQAVLTIDYQNYTLTAPTAAAPASRFD